MNFSVLEIYQIIARLLGTDVQPLFKQDLPGEAFANLADISKAKTIGWSPGITLEQGLQTSINYIRDQISRDRIP